LGKSIKVIEGLGPGVAGRYEVNIDGTSLVMEEDGALSTAYSVVFTNDEDPASATILSDHLTPAVANPKLKNKPYQIYRTPSGSAFIYDVDPDTEVGQYVALGQAAIREWRVTGVTNNFTLPYTPPNSRIMLFINGVHYDEVNYALTGTAVSWAGPFPIESYDTVKVFFF
jgi:hypothetical protein